MKMRVESSSFSCKGKENRGRTNKFTLTHLLFFFAAFVSGAACPDKCVCSTTTVKCVNQDLHAVPQPLPTNTKTLFITGNNITRISAASFPTRLDQLTDLYFTGNQLESLDAKVFSNLPKLRLLDLSNNQIQSFDASAFPANNTVQELVLSRVFYNQSYTEDLLSLLQSGALPKLTRLDLSNNELLVLTDGTLSRLPSLVNLTLQNSSIISIQDGALRGPPLLELDLRDNALRKLSNSTLTDLSLHPGMLLRLAGNPWRCDCNMEDLLAWLKQGDQVQDLQNLTCSDPEELKSQPLVLLEQAQLVCSYSGDMKGVLETSYVFLGMVLALIGVIFLLVLYLNRKGIKRWIYNIRDACRDHMEGYHYRYEINTDPRLANLSINSDV